MNKDEFALSLTSVGNCNSQFGNVSGGNVTINNYNRNFTDGSFDEAVNFYIEEIKTSSLPIIEKALLIEEAPHRIRRFKNKRAVCDKAYEKLENPERLNDNFNKIDYDKIHLILDEAEKVSANDVQEMWSVILKRSVENGGVSKRLINILSKLDSYEAQIFDELCKYLVKFSTRSNDDWVYPLATGFFVGSGAVWGYRIPSLKRRDISRLVNAGLLQIQPDFYEYKVNHANRGGGHLGLNSELIADYLNKRLVVSLSGDWIKCSHFRLTFEGEELYNCSLHTTEDYDSEYYEYILNELSKQGEIRHKQDCKIENIHQNPIH